MVSVKGRSEVKQFLRQTPDRLKRVLRAAGREGAGVIAEEAKRLSVSSEVSGSIAITVRTVEGQIVAKVQTKGRGAFIAPWLEYGTDPHFISVDESQRGGRSVRRINELHKAGTLVIAGRFVGDTVHHPGARPYPFLRPALDLKEGEAVAAAQAYIDAHITRSGIRDPGATGDGE